MFKPESEVFERLHSDINLLNTLNPIHKENANHTRDVINKIENESEETSSNQILPNPHENRDSGELDTSLPSSFDLPCTDEEAVECSASADNDCADDNISDNEAQKILERALNGNTQPKLGRPKGSKEKPTETRADIGMLAHIMGTGKAAQALSLSSGQTALNRLGLTTHGKSKDIDLSTEVKNRLGKIQDVASRKLLSTLELINEEEVEALSVEKQAKVGMDLARILEKAMPKEEEARDITQFIIVKPEVKQESSYDIIDV